MILSSEKGKQYSLECLKSVFSEDVLSITKKHGHRVVEGSDRTIYQRIDGLKKWSVYLQKENDDIAEYLKRFCENDKPIEKHWIAHKIKLANYFKQNFISSGTRSKHISAVNWWLSFFADFAIAPRYEGLPHPDPLIDPPVEVRPKSKKKTVIDSNSEVDLPRHLQDYISDYIDSVASDDPDREEKISLLVHSVKEIASSDSKATPDSFSKLVEEALVRRLVRIRNLAELTFTDAINKREHWLQQAQRGKDNYDNIIKWLGWQKQAGAGNVNPFTSVLDDLSKEEVVQSFLYCLVEKNSPYYGVGFRYSYLPTFKYNRIRKYLQKRGITIEAQDFAERVGASKELLISAQIILVDELDANPSPVRELKRDGVIRFSEDLIETPWVKARANYKRLGLIEVAFSDGNEWRSAHDTIQSLKEATEPYSKYAVPEDKENLFLYNYQNSTATNRNKKGDNVVSTPSDNWFNENTQALLSEVAVVGDILYSTISPS